MTPRRLNDTDLPAANPSSVTLGSGRSISKASLFNVLRVGGEPPTRSVRWQRSRTKAFGRQCSIR
jgi:hypothetical protein